VQVPDDFNGFSVVKGRRLGLLVAREVAEVGCGCGGKAGEGFHRLDSWWSESTLLLVRGLQFKEEGVGMLGGHSHALSVRMQWSRWRWRWVGQRGTRQRIQLWSCT